MPRPSGRPGGRAFLHAPSVYRMMNTGSISTGRTARVFHQESSFSHWFNNVEVTHKRCAVISGWSPAPEPFKDNILFAGDSCWFAEAENTGALLSGHRAANAVSWPCTAAGQPEGVLDYIDWWQKNWPETHNYRDFLCYPVFFRLFTEDELNYLHKVIPRSSTGPLIP